VLKVNLNNGHTLQYDLSNPHDAAEWIEKAKNQHFQEKITAISILLGGVSYSLPTPKDPKYEAFLFGEYHPPSADGKIRAAESISCHINDTKIRLLVHTGQRAARVDITRPGKMQYNSLRGLKYDNS
jgi:hypothetical protein